MAFDGSDINEYVRTDVTGDWYVEGADGRLRIVDANGNPPPPYYFDKGDVLTLGDDPREVEILGRIYSSGYMLNAYFCIGERTNNTNGMFNSGSYPQAGEKIHYVKTREYEGFPVGINLPDGAKLSDFNLLTSLSRSESLEASKRLVRKPIRVLTGNPDESIIFKLESPIAITLSRFGTIVSIGDMGFSQAIPRNSVITEATEEDYQAYIEDNQTALVNTLTVTHVYPDYVQVASAERSAIDIVTKYLFPDDTIKIGDNEVNVFDVDYAYGDNYAYIYTQQDLSGYTINTGDAITYLGDMGLPSELTVTADPVTASNESAVPVSGTATNLPDGTTIDITATDSAQATVTGTALTDIDGNWSTTLDVSTLSDGDITFEAKVTDETGVEQVASVLVVKDTYVAITITLDALADITDDNVSNYTVSGTSDLAEGEVITLVAVDSEGNEITVEATVLADGSFSGELDLGALKNGNVNVGYLYETEAVYEIVSKDVSFIEYVRNIPISIYGYPAVSRIRKDDIIIGFYNETKDSITTQYHSRFFGFGDILYIEGYENIEIEIVGTFTTGMFYRITGNENLDIPEIESANKRVHYKKTRDYGYLRSSDINYARSYNSYKRLYVYNQNDASNIRNKVADKYLKISESESIIHALDATYYSDFVSISLISGQVQDGLVSSSQSKVIATASQQEINAILNTLYVKGAKTKVSGGVNQNVFVVGTSHPKYTTSHIIYSYIKPGDTFEINIAEDGEADRFEEFTFSVSNDTSNNPTDEIIVYEDVTSFVTPINNHLYFGDDTLYSSSGMTAAESIDTYNEAAAPVLGSFTNLEPGTLVKIKATDSAGVSVMGYTSTKEDGTYSGEVDVSALNASTITYEASVVDQKWDTVTATATAEKSSVPAGTLTLDALDDITTANADAYTVTGLTTGLPLGEIITATITDSLGGTLTSTGEVVDGGGFSVVFDANSLENGTATVEVSATDQNGTTLTDSGTVNVDVIPSGSISLDVLPAVDYNNDTAYSVSGGTSEIAEGETVSITIADASSGSVSGSAFVGVDGSWSASLDVSGLADGSLTVDASVVDQRSETRTATATAQKDSRLPGAISITDVPALIDKSNVNTVTISGTTTNTPEANVVNVEVGDGTDTLFTTASVQADGSWSATMGVEALADGILTISVDVDDQRGDVQVDGVQVEKDALWPGSISVSIGSTSDISAVVVSGTTEWVDSGSTVNLEVVDGASATHSFTATTDANGDYQATLSLSAIADGTFTITASTIDETGAVVQDSAQAQKSTSVEQGGEIYVSAETIGKSNVSGFSVWGSTANVPAGQSVTIFAEDASSKAVSTTASVQSDGAYSATLDASGLADGTISITVTTTDEIGGSISASTTTEKDALHPGTITVASEAVGKANVSAVPVSGTTTNTPAGNVVSITATDDEGLIATAEAEVQEDGTYEATLDLNALADGELVIVATVEDETEATISGSATILKDALHPGEITIEAPTVGKDNVYAVEVFGSLLNVPAGSEVWVTAEDSAGSQVSGYTLSEADSYAIEIDVYSLADGTLTLTASTTDETGATINATVQVVKDALLPGSITASMPEVTYNNYNNVQLTGTTEYVIAGEQVSIDVTDTNGKSVSSTATIQDDGTFIRSLDLTELDDGTLSVSVSVMDETEALITASIEVNKQTVSQDDFTLSNLQTHYGRNFPAGISEGQFAIAKNHTLNYVRTFLNAARLEYDMTVYAYIKEAVWDIAHYKLWLNVGTPSESVTLKNERAIEWLKDIARGEVRIKLPEKESRKKGLHTIQLLR